ncbi:MAG: hypothetical protein R3E66_02535 [bacterium]
MGRATTYGQYDVSPCFFGCAAGACNPTPNDQCVGALDVTTGGQFRAAVNLYQNDYDPMVSMVSCTGDDAAGRDAVYKMTLAQGDFVDLKLQGPTDPVLYVSTVCGTNDAIAAACVAGADDSNTPEGLSFVAPIAGTYYIFADLDTTSTTGDFVLDVERRQAGACTPNARACVDANTLSFCDNNGTQSISVSCLGGCVGGRCGQPTGDSCADPIDATGGGLFSVNLDNFTNDYTLTSTSCVGFDTPGNDAVFKIDLNAGDILDARVAGPSSENPALYLVDNCGGIRDQITDHACIDGNDVTGATETLVYTPSGPETVYLVVDSRATFSDDGVFAVDIFAGPPCAVGQISCLDADTLAYCEQAGRETYYPCTGGCSNGACGTPTGDACIDAKPAVIGANTGDFAGTNALDLGTGTSGACTFDSGEAQVGTDHTYYVDLTAGQTLNASFTTNSSFGIMYFTSDCAGQNTCLKDTPDGPSGTLSYTATTSERVYIVIDRTLSGSESFYTYTLNVSVN